jgi:hypothetical protein
LIGLTVVVAARGWPLRLRWLLNALEEQTLDRENWEVVVGHVAHDGDLAALLASHPLTQSGTVRAAPVDGRTRGALRNAAVRLSLAPTIVFTEEDCRPPPDWLQNVLDAVRRHPRAIIQGPVADDPDEWAMHRAPYPYTASFDRVPTAWAQSANIVYPRAVFERLGGFDEDLDGFEDTDLNARAVAAGESYIGERAMLTYGAVDEGGIRAWLRAAPGLASLPAVVRRHPRLRRACYLRTFYRREHFLLLLAAGGLARGVRRPGWLILVAPWAMSRGVHGSDLRGRLRDAAELPGWGVIDLTDTLILVRASLKDRSLVL